MNLFSVATFQVENTWKNVTNKLCLTRMNFCLHNQTVSVCRRRCKRNYRSLSRVGISCRCFCFDVHHHLLWWRLSHNFFSLAIRFSGVLFFYSSRSYCLRASSQFLHTTFIEYCHIFFFGYYSSSNLLSMLLLCIRCLCACVFARSVNEWKRTK